eukprot:TRINITY_DN15028_c0_g1_i4.p1 TRINITY_DN15028_c0_g1~~TRINITY_DN15028_c0_g1_i4.p1  ORF type:complete len:130 (-),score=12.35 TRINITY_DN15028_c0_g1_i4:87-476(-)
MPRARVVADAITYNAVLDSVSDKPIGVILLKWALEIVFTPFWKNRRGTSLIYMSCQKVQRLWLIDGGYQKKHSRAYAMHFRYYPTIPGVITVGGKSRKVWQNSDVQTAVLRFLQNAEIPNKVNDMAVSI